MATINYAESYARELSQAYPYVLNFGALYATPNNGRYRMGADGKTIYMANGSDATFEELQSSISQTSLLRLRELMDADRRGRLVTLPCKVGDTVYRVIRSKDKDGGHITSAVVSGIHMADGRRYKKREAYIVLKVNGCYVSHVPLSNFGKTVFLTQVDAKAALQGEF